MENPITVAQALRHARHDFLNELQLIQMKLDLGRGQEVKSIIRSYAEAAVQLNRLSALKMPATENWLLTAEWRFPEIHFHLECTADKGAVTKDAKFAQWLESFFGKLKPQLDITATYSCKITVQQQASVLEIELEMTGYWQDIELPEIPDLPARKEVAADNTKIIVSAQMEG